MTSLPPLYNQVIGRMSKKDPNIAPADVLAVIIQETNGDPIFSPGDVLYQANMKAAQSGTQLPVALLLDALLIKDGALKGLIAKFRFEPAYWDWSKGQRLDSPTVRFLASCSFGVGQQMMRWVLPEDQRQWYGFIEAFKGDVNTQIDRLILNFRRCLIANGGNIYYAYMEYNSGNPRCPDPVVKARALHVKALRAIVEQQLRGK